jgi:BirA family biotin operon repressor/biotin-[acetyl-CoA-carboxylase] ligase
LIGEPLNTEQGNYRHLFVEETASTNLLCMDYAAAGEVGNLWITAERQTQGKGSRGREWSSSQGNLFASLLLTNPSPNNRLADLTFVAALAVREAIQAFNVADNTVHLKWPNDVLLNQRKCSGILLESVNYQEQTCVIMGIGVNCQNHPENTLHKATSLFAEGIEVSSSRFFLTLANTVANNIALWNKGKDFAEIRKKWLNHAYGIGTKISVKIPGQSEMTGIFEAIDNDGYLLLKTANGVTTVSAADIFFTNAS